VRLLSPPATGVHLFVRGRGEPAQKVTMPSCPPVRIVVAVDFGDASAAAITLAGRLAPRLGATLTAVHAESVEVPPYFTREGFARLERELKMARSVAETELRRFVTSHTDAAIEVRVVDGPAVEAVLDAGADADLIVMGTHGRRGPRRWWLGSIAERVVREAPVPVLVVHAPADPRGDGARAIVVLGGGAGAESRQWSAVLAETLGVPVRDGPPPEQCDATAMTDSAIVVVPVEHAPDTRSVHPRIAALARTCPVPVLFVPAG
jgi:nucleotide-binding universal stress UspA family protein